MNKAEIQSCNNKIKLFIDGIEIKGLQKVNFQRDISNPKATLEIKFKCDLYTKESDEISLDSKSYNNSDNPMTKEEYEKYCKNKNKCIGSI